MKILRTLAVTLPLVLASCSSDDNPVEAHGLNNIRATAISEAAVSYGAQYALAWRASTIQKTLVKHTETLDNVYNFRALLMDHNVMPPILQKSDNSLNISNPNVIRLSDSVIEIIMPARFVTTPPTWHDYVNLEIYKYPEDPSTSVLPKDDEEKELWDKYVRKGWIEGKDQGDQIFINSLNKMTRDFNGMSLYRQLYAQNMITAPFVSKANLGITGNSAKMRLNDQIVRITKPSELTTSTPKSWKPVIVPSN
jgi:defect-in-organelle-trafficking protein DotC